MAKQEPYSGWTISSWSAESGLGTIRSEQLGDFAFDGACASVDDFTVGERVFVGLEPGVSGFRVKSVVPSNHRMPGKGVDTSTCPALERSIEEIILAELADKNPCLDYRVRSFDKGILILEGDEDFFAYGHSEEIEIAGTGYASIPKRFGCVMIRLATMVERAHVAESTTITSNDAVFTVVDDESQLHFVVGTGIQWRRLG